MESLASNHAALLFNIYPTYRIALLPSLAPRGYTAEPDKRESWVEAFVMSLPSSLPYAPPHSTAPSDPSVTYRGVMAHDHLETLLKNFDTAEPDKRDSWVEAFVMSLPSGLPYTPPHSTAPSDPSATYRGVMAHDHLETLLKNFDTAVDQACKVTLPCSVTSCLYTLKHRALADLYLGLWVWHGYFLCNVVTP
jgi:hypothetical protein